MEYVRAGWRMVSRPCYIALRRFTGYHKPRSAVSAEQIARVARNLGSLRDGDGFEAALRREFQRLVDEGYRKRLEIESRTDAGERIWLSHDVRNGRFLHWVVITHGFKYELRRGENKGASRAKRRLVDMGIGGEYYFNAAEATVSEERRRMAVTDYRKPIVGEHFISMIGWTLKSRREVRAAGDAVMGKFGSYNYVLNNCQDFLRRFAKKIVARKADDWEWFFEGALSRYRYEPVTAPVELAVLARVSLQSMRSMRGTVTGRDAEVLELNISRNERYIKEQEDAYVDERSGPDGFDGGHDGGGHDGGNDGGA
ncbi:hypothetical protein LX36DRAFT_669582 [Colletotrichum falcatum]|nr:hypothetical protein LX36DRAFT_669582 [Colletotrichum falcatum]